MSSLREELLKLKNKGGVLSEYVEEALDREHIRNKKMKARRMEDNVRQQVLDYERELRAHFERGDGNQIPCSDLTFKPSVMVETPLGSGHIRGCLREVKGEDVRTIYLVILDKGIGVAMIPGSISHHAVVADHHVSLRKVRRPGDQ